MSKEFLVVWLQLLLIGRQVYPLHSLGTESSFRAQSHSTTTTRRAFVVGAGSSCALFVPNSHSLALADDDNLSALSPLTPLSTPPLRPGAFAKYEPTVIGSSEANEATVPFAPNLKTQLGQSRISRNELSPLPGSFFSDPDVHYPPFLFGAWKVTATLKQKVYPFGTDYVPSPTLVQGSPRNREEAVGNVCNYEMHFFESNSKHIIADRSFNLPEVARAYNQLAPITNVLWDYEQKPSLIQLQFADLSADLRPLGKRRTEIYLQNKKKEALDGDNVFACAEQSRSVTLSPGNAVVTDLETITEFTQQPDDPNQVSAIQRIAYYLSPNPNSREGILWQQVQGKAVALFDYELEMRRITTTGQEPQPFCVTTPKQATQCV